LGCLRWLQLRLLEHGGWSCRRSRCRDSIRPSSTTSSPTSFGVDRQAGNLLSMNPGIVIDIGIGIGNGCACGQSAVCRHFAGIEPAEVRPLQTGVGDGSVKQAVFTLYTEASGAHLSCKRCLPSLHPHVKCVSLLASTQPHMPGLQTIQTNVCRVEQHEAGRRRGGGEHGRLPSQVAGQRRRHRVRLGGVRRQAAAGGVTDRHLAQGRMLCKEQPPCINSMLHASCVSTCYGQQDSCSPLTCIPAAVGGAGNAIRLGLAVVRAAHAGRRAARHVPAVHRLRHHHVAGPQVTRS